MCASVHGFALVCMSVIECAMVCAGVCGSAWVSVSVCVCGMNFQNTYWRIESLHQWTLIRILYNFFIFETYSDRPYMFSFSILTAYKS